MQRRDAILGLLSVVASLPAAIKPSEAIAQTTKDAKGKMRPSLSFAETLGFEYPVTIKLEDGWMHVHMTPECRGIRFSIGNTGADVNAQDILNALLCSECDAKGIK